MSIQISKRRIPIILGLVLLLCVIAISVSLVQSGIFYIGNATPDPSPQKVQIANVTDTSFTVVYITRGPYEGIISLRSGNGNKIFLDDRDRNSGIKEKYNSHHITALNLLPNSTYSFQIISGGTTYDSASFSVTTGSVISSPPPPQNPLYGKVIHKDGTDAWDSVIFANNESSLLVSAVTNARGEFIIPTNSLRNITNDNYSILNDDSQITIEALNKDLIATVNTVFKIAQNLPTITLQQTYQLAEDYGENSLPPVFSVDENDELITETTTALASQDYSTKAGELKNPILTPTITPSEIFPELVQQEEDSPTLSITDFVIQSLFPFLQQN